MTAEDSSGGGGGPRPGTAGAAVRKEEDAVAVRVAVHIRPLVEQELAKGCQEILDVSPSTPQICVGQHTFTYDNVYGSGGGDDAANLYPDCVEPLVEGLFKGYNATVFAYGQTGSGKTFTMGSSWSPDLESQGVIPSVMDEMFTRMEAESNTDFVVKVSFVEIHKEEVRDLLWTNSAAPRPVVTIRELPSGVSLAGACERQVHSREEMSHLLMQGTLVRAVASTNMNNRSSRSHAIFTITLEQRKRHIVRPASAPPAVEYTPGGSTLPPPCANSDTSEGESTEEEDEEELEGAGDDYLIAKMHLVDLAGSERAKRTGAQGARLKEAININKGLLALAKVITALVDNQSHVPYRDSKLTRLLQDSLGGNSRTVMIACVSPADINREESLNTLRYADRARRIKNKPVVNRDPVAAQLAALRQQIAGLRAENTALRTALGGDAAAASVFAAAGRSGQSDASEALQEAYDDLAVRCNALEVQNAKQQMELDTAHAEVQVLRSGMLSAETERDQALLRLEALQLALAASSDDAVKAALQQDAAAAAGRPASSIGGSQADAALDPTAAEQQQQPAGGIMGDLGVVAGLRARVSELESELRQVRSLQRMTSSVLVRGMSSGGMGLGRASVRGARARGSSNAGSGGAAAAGAGAHGNRGNSRHGSPPHPHAAAGLGISLEGVSLEEEDEDACSPMTPARQAADELDEPLMEVESDAEVLAQSAAHMMAREAMNMKLAALARQMEAKQKRLLALQSAADMEGAKSKYMMELQKERDTLAKEKTALLQKLQAVEVAGAEERKRLQQQYRDKLTSVERRLKELADREKAAKRSAAQLGRVQAVCQQLTADISRMKSARAAVQRRMEAKEKEFREWRLMREREVLQLRRNAQRQSAALQQHQAMHSKQQAVLKRKTEEAEAARRKLRDLLELQARVRRDKRPGQGAGTDECGSAPADLELQPNAAAPLLRTEKARREWVEQELELCSTSWQYQKVLDGELAQRAEATRKLREVQKQLMLLGGLVPPSPVVTAAAAAAAAASRGAGAAAAAAAAAKAALPREEVLQQEAARLQAAIDKHSANVKELQEQWERARADEQSRGAGAADVKRWTGIRNIIEARELLRTLFMCACAQKAQVCEGAMDLAKLQETADILQIKLDMSVQQAAEAKRKALEAEATTAAVITTPAHHLALAAAAAAASDRVSPGPQAAHDGRDDVDIEADNLLHSMGLPPIMETPTPSDDAFSPAGSAHADALAGRAHYAHNSVGRRSLGRQRYASPGGGNSSSRYQELLRLQMAGSSDTGDAAGAPVSASARVSGRWGGSYASSRATSASSNSSSHTAAAAAFMAGGRSLAAQVSFNHEKRRGWERPVLEDINSRRASAGLAAVDKLTIQLLKEAMTGQEIDGRIWTAGAKTKDNLIADYRRMLHLNERVDEETDIDRITGAATWSMPSSPTSQPQQQQHSSHDAAADAAAAGGAAVSSSQRSRMADGGAAAGSSGGGNVVRRSSSMGTSLAAGGAARRVLSAGSNQSDSQPGSAPGSSYTSPSPRHSIQGDSARVAVTGSSPFRALGRSSSASGRYRSPGHSAAGGGSNTSSNAGGGSSNASMLGAAGRQVVAQSMDGSLLAGGGAERILREHSPAGALQQAPQRSTQRSSSQKLNISIPSSRVDGPYSARLPLNSSSGGGSNSSEPKSQVPSAERSSSNSRHGQPSWR
ncbi:hypothetical protein OEZ86_005467 [Tetradesmus obliquus]|nr:hypothetical protein OEZ86_005467 [Tetradesmus obliquus]